MAQRPNPISIGVCALIALYSDPESLLHDLDDDDGSSTDNSGDRLEYFLEQSVFEINFYGNCCKNNHSATQDWLKIWVVDLKRSLGPQAAKLLLDTLQMAAESIDALMDLFESLKGAVKEGLVDAGSIHGLFLRQHCLGFDELSFESTVLMWQALRECLSVVDYTELKLIKETDPISHGCNNSSPLIWSLSSDQLQATLIDDCYRFDSMLTRYNHVSHKKIKFKLRSTWNQHMVSFDETEIHVRKMLKIDRELPAAHFLRYLNCLRHRERVGALDALHEYFDNVKVRQGRAQNGQRMIDGKWSSGVVHSKDVLQFSAILLAMTHSSFGNLNLAFLATEEAVRVAQQSKDDSCVTFALGWLYENHGLGTADRLELLRRCTVRATHGRLRLLATGAHLTLAKNSFRIGTGVTKRRARSHELVSNWTRGNAGVMSQARNWTTSWSYLMQVTAEPSIDQSGALDPQTYLSHNPHEVWKSIALQHLFSAGIWDSLAMPRMSKWASIMVLNKTNDLTYNDSIVAIANVSRCFLYGSSPARRQERMPGREPHRNKCGANSSGTSQLVTCSYARAVHAMFQLGLVLDMKKVCLEIPILQNLSLTLHEWAVNRGDMSDAKALQVMMESYLHSGLHNREQYYIDTRIQQYIYLRRVKDWEKAKRIGTSLVKYCKDRSLFTHEARILIQMGITELEFDKSGWIMALSPLLEAMGICEKFELHGLHAMAISILAEIFVRMNRPECAIATLQGALPTLLQRGHVWFQAEAYLTFSKGLLSIHANAMKSRRTTDLVEHDSSLCKQCWHRALQTLNKSMNLFEECQDRYRLREVLYLRANLYELLGNLNMRNLMSERFVALGNSQNHSPVAPCSVEGRILRVFTNPLAMKLLVSRSIY